MQQLQSVWDSLDMRRRGLLVGSALALVAMVVILGRIAASPGMSLLYAGLEDAAAGEVIQALEARSIPYAVRGDAVFVPSNSRDETRLMLAASGLPTNTYAGYELLENLSGFGTTSQMFDAAYWRAKQGELARTIVASPHIRTARVHIAQAGSSPFRREISPTASVTVVTTGAGLNPTQARALRFLVASAVAGMAPDDVSVIDGNGGLVYGPDSDLAISATGGDRAQQLRRNVERLLEAHVGHGRAVVEVSVETVTDREHIHERRLDPEARVAISTEVEENSVTSTDTRRQGVTVASNLPDGDAAGADGTAEARETQTRQRTNFELTETRRELERLPGAVRRITVAVLIDGQQVAGEDGQLRWAPRPAEELEALRDLVASAIGFDESRGDVITLRSLPFEPVAALGSEAGGGLFATTSLDLMTLLKWAFLLLALLLISLFGLRPVLKALGRSAQEAPMLPPGQEFAALPRSEKPDANGLAPMQDAQQSEDEDPVARLQKLIDARGQEAVHVLRHWMDERKERS